MMNIVILIAALVVIAAVVLYFVFRRKEEINFDVDKNNIECTEGETTINVEATKTK